MRLDIHWRTSLLAAIARCDTLDALRKLWKTWAADVATCEWRDEIVAAKDARKADLARPST